MVRIRVRRGLPSCSGVSYSWRPGGGPAQPGRGDGMLSDRDVREAQWPGLRPAAPACAALNHDLSRGVQGFGLHVQVCSPHRDKPGRRGMYGYFVPKPTNVSAGSLYSRSWMPLSVSSGGKALSSLVSSSSSPEVDWPARQTGAFQGCLQDKGFPPGWGRTPGLGLWQHGRKFPGEPSRAAAVAQKVQKGERKRGGTRRPTLAVSE